MKANILSILTVAACLLLPSCEKAILIDTEEPSEELGERTAKLTVITRADDANNTVAQGCIYVFNSAGKCVQLMSTTTGSNSATVMLAAGSYSLYAVGSDDLTRFNLPTQSNATPTSIITLAEGKTMGDLLLKKADVTLEDGETLNQTIALEHKVLCINDISIKKVPANVTKVEVSISPLYGSVTLSGTYPDTPVESYKIGLTKQSDGTTWLAEPEQMLFPSAGTPTIKIMLTTSEGTQGYSYTASEELPANHHFSISGTYMAAQGVSITGLLTTASWGEDRSITFNFDDNNAYAETPVAQQFYDGYYVISVNSQAKTAVVLSKRKVEYTAPSSGSAESAWLGAFEQPMADLEKPTGASGAWRLPTLSEVQIFTKDTQVVTFGNNGNTPSYFCLDGSTLMWAYTNHSDDEYVFKKGTNYNSSVLLRPVISIAY